MSLARDASADSPEGLPAPALVVSPGSFGFHHMLRTHLITSGSRTGACLQFTHVSQMIARRMKGFELTQRWISGECHVRGKVVLQGLLPTEKLKR